MELKKSWGKYSLKYCPVSRKVWQYSYDTNKNEYVVVIHNDMPSYGLKRKEIPTKD
tara:strand:- start:4135 stop:4302 length:168 start_codon:yes stop_codon:yes gene_type:complete